MAGYGPLTVGRLVLAEPMKVSERAGSLSLSGQESSVPLTRAQLYAVHADLISLRDSVVPVTFPDKPERDGFYSVSSASSELTDWQNEVVTADWKIDLVRLGSTGEVDLSASLFARARPVASAVTGVHWHGLPVGADAYDTGATLPLTIARTGSDGVVPVYYSVPLDTSPRWRSTAAGSRLGRARLLDAGREVSGVRDVAPAAWELSNSLVRVKPLAGAGAAPSLEVATWLGGDWRIKQWALYADGDMLGPWTSATILRNDFEECGLRLTSSRPAGGRLTLDVWLRRGGRMVDLHAETGVASFWTADLWATEAAATVGNYRAGSADDANGLRFQVGSTTAFGLATHGGIVTSAAAQTWSGWLGVQLGASPSPGEAFLDLQAQYVGSPDEVVTAVPR
jgi:hypothetical protein